MPTKIPFYPVIYPVVAYPQDFRKSLLRYPKYIEKFSAKSYSLSHYSKILSRAKIRHHFDVQEVSMSNSALMKTVTKLSARSKKTCKDIQVPSRMSISLNKLKAFNNLRSIDLKGNLKTKKHLYNLKVTDLVYKAPMIADRESKEIVFTKHNPINYISFHVRWNVESMSNLRRTAQKVSQIPTLQKAALKIEEIDMCVYLHSFHSLAFWAKLATFIVTIDTWESLGGAVEYANKMTNLKRFGIETGPRFAENAVKKQYYSLDVVNKFGNFPVLETLEIAFDFRGLIQQSIEFLLNMKYPKSLLCLDEKLMLPDIDTLVQKMNKSLSLTTYLSVENQSPFKEFIKNHESLGALKKFRSELVTKQMMGSHSKLYRGLLAHMKGLEQVDISIYAQQAKPFLYLGIYNLLLMGDKVKKLSLHIQPSYVDFSGSELLEVENKLSGLREMKISCPGERFANEKVQSFFKSTIQKQIEEIELDFVQEVTDQELEKRFMLLGKCDRLKKLLLRFKVRDFSDVSLEKIWEVIMRSEYLEVVDLELEGAEIDKRDMDRMRQYAEIKRRIRILKIKATNYEVIKEEGSTVCLLENVGTVKSGAIKA